MTIYTPSLAEKKVEKDTAELEVVTEPLTSFKDEPVEDSADAAHKQVLVTYFPRSRRSFYIHLLLTIMVLVILVCGAIGAIFFYRHFNKKVYSGKCGNVYFDTTYHGKDTPAPKAKAGAVTMDFFEEEIEVSEIDLYESLHTPAFDEVRENTVLHDFGRRDTAIVDHEWERCYIKELNRTAIAPPSDVLDLMHKLASGYYMQKAEVVRENYRLIQPPVKDLSQFGHMIQSRCMRYATFRVEKIVSGVYKRSVSEQEDSVYAYAMLSNKPGHQVIYKLLIHEHREMAPAAA